MFIAHFDYTTPVWNPNTSKWDWLPQHNEITISGEVPDADYSDPLEMDNNLYNAVFPFLEYDGYPNITTYSYDKSITGKAWDNAHGNKKVHPYLIPSSGASLVAEFKSLIKSLKGCLLASFPLFGDTLSIPCDTKTTTTEIAYDNIVDITNYHLAFKPLRKTITTTTTYTINNLSRTDAETIAKVLSCNHYFSVESDVSDFAFNTIKLVTKRVTNSSSWHVVSASDIDLNYQFSANYIGFNKQLSLPSIENPSFNTTFNVVDNELPSLAISCPFNLSGTDEYILSTLIRLPNGYLYPESLTFTDGELTAQVLYRYSSGRSINDANLFKLHTFS